MSNLTQATDHAPVTSWEEISREVELVRLHPLEPLPSTREAFLSAASQGTAFLTFAIGIDGVSIEIAKYAQSLEDLYGPDGGATLHFIAGKFAKAADTILEPDWIRHKIKGINGWSKWDDEKWFSALFFEDMPAGSHRSSIVAAEVYRQAKKIAAKLRKYLVNNNIGLLIPVNVSSNPGNLALALALVFVSETLGTVVINSNHDFYWDSGKPADEREHAEEQGERDHFFHNMDNQAFFALFQKLYPWHGRRWLQVNINKRQSKRVVKEFGLPPEGVFEIGTCVDYQFFAEYAEGDVRQARLRMAHILSDGEAVIHPRSLEDHKQVLDRWMENQHPQVIGAGNSLTLDLLADDIIYLLQPTRIVPRKRIEKDIALIYALLQGPLLPIFTNDPERQLVLHISGPTPLEHQDALEAILEAYELMINNLPDSIARRIFLAFSVGRETHPSFKDKSFDDLNISDIYKMATATLFPSQIEGRGLPIIESCAAGVPIICSRYHPEEVFSEVVGEDLPEAFRIHYQLFPEEEFADDWLLEVAEILTVPDAWSRWRARNRRAVRSRYSRSAMSAVFQRLLDLSYQYFTEPVL